MDKELIKEIKNKIVEDINKLEKENGVLQNAFDEESKKSFEKTNIQKEIEKEQGKISLDIEKHRGDIKRLTEIVEQDEDMKSNEKAIENLKKDKISLEIEISQLSGRYEVGEDGKLKKSSELEKFEQELEKVSEELNAQQKKSEKYKGMQEEINQLADKYKVNKDRKIEEEQKNKEEETIEEPEEKVEENKEEIAEEPEEKIEENKEEIVEKPEENKEEIVEEPKQSSITMNQRPKNKLENVRIDANLGFIITLTNEKGEIIQENFGKEYMLMDSKEQEEKLKIKGILTNAKGFDVGLYNALKEIDKKYNINTVKDYEDMLKNKYLKNKENKINIDYDFSNVWTLSKNDEEKSLLQKYKRIAKDSSRLGLASYKKEPNIFKKIWHKITQKALTKGSSKEIQETNKDSLDSKTIEDVQKTVEEALKYQEEVENAYNQLHDEENFDIENFIKAYKLNEQEATKYRNNFEIYESKKDSKEESFKKKLKINTKKSKVNEEKQTDQQQEKEIEEEER